MVAAKKIQSNEESQRAFELSFIEKNVSVDFAGALIDVCRRYRRAYIAAVMFVCHQYIIIVYNR